MEDKKIILVLIFIIGMSMLTTVSAQDIPTKITGGSDKMSGGSTSNDSPLADRWVKCNDRIEIQARLMGFDWRPLSEDYTWEALCGRYIDLQVTNSRQEVVYQAQAITNLFTTNANFDIFRLNESGDYTCKLSYGGHGYLKPCDHIFRIHVSKDSAPDYGDTRITAPEGLVVKKDNDIEIQAKLWEYQECYFIDDCTRWHSLQGRYLDMTIENSKGEIIHTDRTITNLWTHNANFDIFRLNESGNYICYIRYAGNLKPCMTKFNIRVNP